MTNLSVSLYSQVIDGKQYNLISNWYNWQGGRFITNLNLPKVTATTGRDTGGIRYSLADSSIYVYTGSQWRQVGGSSGVTSVFGRTGAVTALEADYNAFYPLLSATYNNPSWLNQLEWSKITGTPTTLGGYGITDVPAQFNPIAGTNMSLSGTYPNITFNASGGSTGGTTNGRVFYTSQAGLVSDADLSYGSSTFGTDNTTAMQAVLDSALNGPVIIFVDGKYSATQLKVRSNTTLIMLAGCGFIQRDNSDLPFVVNYNRSTSIIDSTITITGGIINQNGYRAGSFRQAKTSATGWNHAMRFAGVSHVAVRGVTIYSSRNFGIFFSSFRDVEVKDIVLRNNDQINQDGLKLLVGQGAVVENITGHSMGDDVVSICANDGFWPTSSAPCPGILDSFAVYGTISNIVVKNITINSSTAGGFRLLSRSELVDNIFIDGLYFNSKGLIFIDDYTFEPDCIYSSGKTNGNFGRIQINNVFSNIGNLTYEQAFIYVNGYIRDLTINGLKRDMRTVTADQPVIYFGTTSNVINFNLSNATIKKTNFVNTNVIDIKGSVRNITLNNVEYTDSLGSYSPLLAIDTSSLVDNVQMNLINVTGAKNIFRSRADSIGSMNLTNITHFTCDSTYGSFFTKHKINDAALNSYFGIKAFGDTGTIRTKRGDYLQRVTYADYCGIDTLHKSDFIGTNGTAITSYTPEIGSAWTNAQGTWVINSNSAVPSGTATNNNWIALTDVGATQYKIRTRVQRGTSSNGRIQIWLKTTDISNGVALNIGEADGNGGFYNIVGGTATSFVTISSGAVIYNHFSASSELDIEVYVRGDVVSVFINGMFYAKGTIPTTQTGTKAGFGQFSTAVAGDMFFRDIIVTEL